MTCTFAGTFRFGCLVSLCAAMAALGCNGPNHNSLSYDSDKDESEWIKGASRPPSPRTLLAMARILIAQGRLEKGQFVLQKIVQEHPQFPEAYVELAELHMRQRHVEMAVRTLQQGLLNVPNDPVMLNDMGIAWIFRNQYNAAENVFRQASTFDPGNTRYRANLAMAVALQGRYEEALSIYQDILSPSDAHTNVAIIAEARNDTARAKSEHHQADELRRKN